MKEIDRKESTMEKQWNDEFEEVEQVLEFEEEESKEKEPAISFYMEEVADLVELTKEEEESLFLRYLDGDDLAKERLIEGNLKRVLQVSANYIGKGIPLGDLIQEGNIALLIAMTEFEGTSLQEFHSYMEQKVREMMEQLLDLEDQEENAGKKMVERANLLSEASKLLADELGREPSAEELARRLSMTEEEIKDIMKMSLDALSVMSESSQEEGEIEYPEDLKEAMEELEQDQY